MKVLFFIKKTELDRDNKAPILARITIDSLRAQFNTKCKVLPDEWDTKNNRVKGRSKQAQDTNFLLENIHGSLTKHYWEIINTESLVTAEKVKNAFLGLNQRKETLLQVFEEHNESKKSQIGKGVSLDTYQKYERTKLRLEDFMKHKYNVADINIREITLSFLENFEVYLKAEHGCSHNTAIKFMQKVKTIILKAFHNGWIKTNPFAQYKLSLNKVEREFLTDGELKKIMSKKFPTPRLENVRDIFIFSCFTGLAYIDVQSLTQDNIRSVFDDSLWIIGQRVKTEVTYRVPLMDIPKKILEKYKGTLPDGVLLPVISNQKMNAYLKEIADTCGIRKNLTFHVARHKILSLSL